MPNPLDMLLRQYATPALIEAGFSKKSRQYRLTNDNGDLVALAFQTSQTAGPQDVAFFLEFGLIPAAYRDWRESADPDISLDSYAWGIIRYRFEVPAHVFPPDTWGFTDQWQFAPESDHGVGGAALEFALRNEVIPLLQQLLEPVSVLDVAVNPLERRWYPTWWLRFSALLDLGPSAELSAEWKWLADNSFGRELKSWATKRLRSRFGIDDSWPEVVPMPSIEQVVAEATEFIELHLVPVMATAGFSRIEGSFRRHNDLGDELIVEIAPAHVSTEGRILLWVDVGVMPIMEWEYLRDRGRERAEIVEVRRPARVLDSWFRIRLEPPDEYADADPSRQVLGLRLWSIPVVDVARGGRAMAGAVGTNLTAWLRLLDRDHLRQLALDRTRDFGQRLGVGSFTHADLVLSIDLAEPVEISVKINKALQDPVTKSFDADVIAWAQRRIGLKNTERRDS